MVALERWKMQLQGRIPAWIEAVGNIEALNSLATFAFNHPGYIYPSPVAESSRTQCLPALTATELAHPLIPAARRIANDFSIGLERKADPGHGIQYVGEDDFSADHRRQPAAGPMRITGLRGVVLVHTDAIVDFAAHQRFVAGADFLLYGGAEKAATDRLRLRNGNPALVLIDEILRGTNSEDKTYGSEQFARKLTGYRLSVAVCYA